MYLLFEASVKMLRLHGSNRHVGFEIRGVLVAWTSHGACVFCDFFAYLAKIIN